MEPETARDPGTVERVGKARVPARRVQACTRVEVNGGPIGRTWTELSHAYRRGEGEDVLFAERCDTQDGLAKLVPVDPVGPAEATDAYILITGRMLEHWHTGVMTRRSHVLDELEPEAFLCINGQDLTALDAGIGDELRVTSRRGALTARARLDESLPAGTILMPFCFAEAAANILTNPALDPESKIPEYKYSAVRIERAKPRE